MDIAAYLGRWVRYEDVSKVWLDYQHDGDHESQPADGDRDVERGDIVFEEGGIGSGCKSEDRRRCERKSDADCHAYCRAGSGI